MAVHVTGRARRAASANTAAAAPPGRRQQHVSLVGEAADPDHGADDVQPQDDEAHVSRDAVSAARAAATSEKSAKKRSGAHAVRSAAGWKPVATATATAPQARAQSTSSGVSPMIVTSSKAKARPVCALRPLARHRRQAPAVHRRRSRRRPRGTAATARSGASFTRAPSLDVAGQEPHHGVGARGQRADELGDAGHHAHARAVADEPPPARRRRPRSRPAARAAMRASSSPAPRIRSDTMRGSVLPRKS